MGEAAKSYWLEEFIESASAESVDTEVQYFSAVSNGETEDDWKYGSD